MEMTHVISSGNSMNDPVTGKVFHGPSDERERQIALVCDIIRMASEAGLRGLNYNATPLGHMRTNSTTGRGGARLSTFDYDEFLEKGRAGDPEGAKDTVFEGGAADADELWRRLAGADWFTPREAPLAAQLEASIRDGRDKGFQQDEVSVARFTQRGPPGLEYGFSPPRAKC